MLTGTTTLSLPRPLAVFAQLFAIRFPHYLGAWARYPREVWLGVADRTRGKYSSVTSRRAQRSPRDQADKTPAIISGLYLAAVIFFSLIVMLHFFM